MGRWVLVTAATVCWVAFAAPASANVVSLAQLEQLALRDRQALAIDAAHVRAADAEIERARSGARPRIDLEARTSVSPGRELIEVEDRSGEAYKVAGQRAIDQDDAFLPQVRYGLDVELRHNIYDFGRTAASVEAARAARATAQARGQASSQRILQQLRAAYLVWLSRAELHAIAERAAADARARRERVEALIAEGARPAAELSPAQADEMLAALELERARGELAEAKLSVAQVVGQPLEASAQPDRSLLELSAADGAGSGGEAALRALERQRDAENARARAALRTDAPVLAGVVSAGVHAQNDTAFPSYAVGVSLKVPLSDGGSAEASASAARARAQALAATIDDHSQALADGRARAALAQQNAGARLRAAEALLKVSQARLADAERAYELGAGGLQGIGQARAMLRRAETEVVLAKVARAGAVLEVR